MENIKFLNDTEIRVKGIEILNQFLGPAMALRFLSLISRESTDYVEISRRIYKDQTIDDIFIRTKENWKA
jgi:hypothetical protein